MDGMSDALDTPERRYGLAKTDGQQASSRTTWSLKAQTLSLENIKAYERGCEDGLTGRGD
jgi:hypothetical protein